MDLQSLTSRNIRTWYTHLQDKVSFLRSIDAPQASILEGGFSVGPGTHVTLAQLNPVWYIGNWGLTSENRVFSVRFTLYRDAVTNIILGRTRAIIVETFRMDDSSEVDVIWAEKLLESRHGIQLERFAQQARDILRIPFISRPGNPTISRLNLIEESLNLLYSRVILLYFIQNQIPQVRLKPDGQYTIWTGWPKAGTGEIFQATAVLRRKVANLNLRILDNHFNGLVTDESWIRTQMAMT